MRERIECNVNVVLSERCANTVLSPFFLNYMCRPCCVGTDAHVWSLPRLYQPPREQPRGGPQPMLLRPAPAREHSHVVEVECGPRYAASRRDLRGRPGGIPRWVARRTAGAREEVCGYDQVRQGIPSAKLVPGKLCGLR